jgi:hypothetical protein
VNRQALVSGRAVAALGVPRAFLFPNVIGFREGYRAGAKPAAREATIRFDN